MNREASKSGSIDKMVLTASQNQAFRIRAAILVSRVNLLEGMAEEARLIAPLLDIAETGGYALMGVFSWVYYRRQ